MNSKELEELKKKVQSLEDLVKNVSSSKTTKKPKKESKPRIRISEKSEKCSMLLILSRVVSGNQAIAYA